MDAADEAPPVSAIMAVTSSVQLDIANNSNTNISSRTVPQVSTLTAARPPPPPPPPPSTSSILSLKVNTFMKFIRGSVGQWSIMDATLGLKYFAANNKGRDEVDMVKFIEEASQFDSRKEGVEMARILKWSEMMTQIDNKPRDKFLAATHIQDQDLIAYNVIATHERTGYCILLDHKEKTVLLSLRGTHNTNDMLIDLQAVSIPFSVCTPDGQIVCEGHAHKGMYLAAKWFEENIVHTLDELLQKNPDYSLVITGHSLGGGVGAVLTILIRPRFPNVRCIAIAPPSCVDAALADAARAHITALILADDIVPRTSTVSMEKLRAEVEQYNWREEFHRDLQANRWTANISYYLERKGWVLPRAPKQDGLLNAENPSPVISSDIDPDSPVSPPTSLPTPAPPPPPPNSSSSSSGRTPMSILSNLSGFFSNDSGFDSGYDFFRKKSSSGSLEQMDIEMNNGNDPQSQTADATKTAAAAPPTGPEFSTIRLHPPGRLLHMRRFGTDERVYIKDAHYREFETIPLVPTCISDHRMANYYNTLLDFSEQDVQLECLSATETHHRLHPYIHESEDDLQEWQVVQTNSNKHQKRPLVVVNQEQIRADVKHYLQDEEGEGGVFNPFVSPKKQKISPSPPRHSRSNSNSDSSFKSSWWDD